MNKLDRDSSHLDSSDLDLRWHGLVLNCAPVLNQPFFFHNLLLHSQEPLGECLGSGRTAGHIDVHRNDLIDSLANRIGQLK